MFDFFISGCGRSFVSCMAMAATVCIAPPGGASILAAAPLPVNADMDADRDVDLGDLRVAQICQSGPDVAADPTCPAP